MKGILLRLDYAFLNKYHLLLERGRIQNQIIFLLFLSLKCKQWQTPFKICYNNASQFFEILLNYTVKVTGIYYKNYC